MKIKAMMILPYTTEQNLDHLATETSRAGTHMVKRAWCGFKQGCVHLSCSQTNELLKQIDIDDAVVSDAIMFRINCSDK